MNRIDRKEAKAPAATGPVVDAYPLSPVQEGMLFHHLLAPHSGVDVVQRWCTISPDLDETLFEKAWQRVIECHPVLRTSFLWETVSTPVQQVHEWVTAPLERLECVGDSAADVEARFGEILRQDRLDGFDLSRPPFLRLKLIRIKPSEQRFLFTMHHALFDGRSDALLFEDVCLSYEAIRNGADARVAARRPYADYIAWLKKRDESGDEGFWRESLKGFTSPTPLQAETAGRSDSGVFSIPGQERIVLSPEITASLRALARKHGVTLNTLALGAWSVLLSRYSGEEDVLFGVTRAGRRSTIEGAESMIGMFINTLPLRVAVPADLPLADWLASVRARWVALGPYEQTPLVKIHRWSEVPGDRRLFETLFVFEERRPGDGESEVPTPWMEPGFRHIGQTDVPLMVAAEAGADLAITIEYDRRRFQGSLVSRMLEHFARLLESMQAAGPGAKVGDLSMLNDAERRLILEVWNPPEEAGPEPGSVVSRIDAQAARTPDAVAVRHEDREWTYGELASRTTRVASRLRELGVGPETLVGVSLPRSFEMVAAVLGILKAGGAYLPLDPDYPKRRLASIVRDARPGLLIAAGPTEDMTADMAIRTLSLEDLELESPDAVPSEPIHPEARDRAYVLYTSGSTGAPNGVEVEHGSLANYIACVSRLYELAPGDAVLQFSSLSFDASCEEIFATLASGATLVLRNDSMLESAPRFLRQCREWGISVLPLPTAYWNELVAGSRREDIPDSLRLVVIGGEPAASRNFVKWRRISGKVRLLNAYGPTEATVAATFWEPPLSAEVDGPTLPIGRPISHVTAYVLDGRRRLLPAGVAGELYIGGRGLARGYLNRPDLTRQKFFPDPFSKSGGRLYKSGDRARFRLDGTLEFLGRMDHQVKIRGYRIELEEIEAAIADQPGVRECVVTAREGWSGSDQLVAYLVCDTSPEGGVGAETTFRRLVSEIRTRLQERLPAHMLPYDYVSIDRIPMNANGKVDRAALPDPSRPGAQVPDAAEAAGSGSRGGLGKGRKQALDETESALAEIWQRILKVRRVEPTDNFFDLGGHSLLAVRLFVQIEKATGKKLPLATIFRAQTVAELAARIREKGPEAAPSSLVAISPAGSRPPLFCVHSLGGNALEYRELGRFLAPDQPLYGLQPQGLDGRLPPHATVEEMAAHYIREIRQVQPAGPYRLGGWSFGGVIAFEMSRQLQAAGDEIALLALLDTHYLPKRPTPDSSFFPSLLRSAAHVGRRLAFHAGALHRLDRSHRRPYVGRKLRVALHWTIRDFYSAVRHPLPEAIRRVLAANNTAAQKYVAAGYDGTVTLFRALDDRVSSDSDPFLGWGELVRDGIEVVEVPGDHHSLIQGEINARALAARLMEKLQDPGNRARQTSKESAIAG